MMLCGKCRRWGFVFCSESSVLCYLFFVRFGFWWLLGLSGMMCASYCFERRAFELDVGRVGGVMLIVVRVAVVV